MFRKLISNISFSPSLMTDIGFYANRLRSEEATRRTTIMFVVFAIIMQSLAVFSPPESANASSEQDIIHGGVSNLDDLLLRYDHNESDLKDIYDTLGITRAELASAHSSSIPIKSDTYITTRYGQLGHGSNEVSVSYPRSTGGVGVRYLTPYGNLSNRLSSTEGWIGSSSTLGWFAIAKANGGVILKSLPSSYDKKTSSLPVTKTLTAKNLSQPMNHDAVAEPNDKIAYTLKAVNPADSSQTSTFEIRIDDLLEYATLIDAGAGDFDTQTNTLRWPQVQLSPGEAQDRTFAIQLISNLPATPAGQSNPGSYDCTLSATYGNLLQQQVQCPAAKGVEGFLQQLPSTGIGINIAAAVVLFATSLYFYARTKQMKKELRIIRHNINSSTI